MGNENYYQNEEENNKNDLSNVKRPEFQINKSYPIHDNKTLKDIIQNYLDGRTDSFEMDNTNNKNNINNQNNIDKQKLLSPKFNTKSNFKRFNLFNIYKNDNNKENIQNNEEFEKNNKIINITHTEKYLKDKNIDKDLDNNDKKGYQIINNNENNFINNNNKIVE